MAQMFTNFVLNVIDFVIDIKDYLGAAISDNESPIQRRGYSLLSTLSVSHFPFNHSSRGEDYKSAPFQ